VTVTAKHKFVGASPFKMRKYAQLFKGKPIAEARAILAYHPSPTCESLLKVLNSAVANAENNFEMDPEMLYVKNVLIDGGPTLKRMRPRARGRGNRILKRTSHILIELDLQPKFQTKAEAPVAEEKAAKPKRHAAKPAAKAAAKPSAKTAAKPAAKADPKAKAAKAEKPKAEEKTEKAPKPKKEKVAGEKPKATKKAADKKADEGESEKPKRSRSTKKATETEEPTKG
jgi:large subunit ribosomal protein L22